MTPTHDHPIGRLGSLETSSTHETLLHRRPILCLAKHKSAVRPREDFTSMVVEHAGWYRFVFMLKDVRKSNSPLYKVAHMLNA